MKYQVSFCATGICYCKRLTAYPTIRMQKLPFIESEQCRRFQLNSEISGKYVRPTLT